MGNPAGASQRGLSRCEVHSDSPNRLLNKGRNPTNRRILVMTTNYPRLPNIWIDPYYRIRNGRLQHVRGHWRAWPSPRSLRPRLSLSA